MKRLTSDSNPLFRRWLKLATHPRTVRELGQTLAEGFHLAEAAARADWPVQAALVRHGSAGEAIEAALARLPPRVETFELAALLYDRIAPVEHGAGLTLVVAVRAAALPAACRHDLMYLDAVQDPTNVGALLRIAAAGGVGQVLCGPSTAAAWSPRAMRAAMGAHFRLDICEAVEPAALPSTLAGAWIGAVVQDAPSLWSLQWPPGAVGWAFGSEGSGLSAPVLVHCARCVTIPLTRDIESLNVAAAAAVCLFERRRRLAGDA